MAEYDGHTLYAGGEGCFSLQTTLTPDQLRRLGQAVLDLLRMDHHIERGDFPVLLDHSYRPYDVSPCHVLTRHRIVGHGSPDCLAPGY